MSPIQFISRFVSDFFALKNVDLIYKCQNPPHFERRIFLKQARYFIELKYLINLTKQIDFSHDVSVDVSFSIRFPLNSFLTLIHFHPFHHSEYLSYRSRLVSRRVVMLKFTANGHNALRYRSV